MRPNFFYTPGRRDAPLRAAHALCFKTTVTRMRLLLTGLAAVVGLASQQVLAAPSFALSDIDDLDDAFDGSYDLDLADADADLDDEDDADDVVDDDDEDDEDEDEDDDEDDDDEQSGDDLRVAKISTWYDEVDVNKVAVLYD